MYQTFGVHFRDIFSMLSLGHIIYLYVFYFGRHPEIFSSPSSREGQRGAGFTVRVEVSGLKGELRMQ